MSEDILISDNFSPGSNVVATFDIPLVGNIMMAKLKVSAADMFMCDSVSVSLTFKTWYFPCQEPYNNSAKDGYTLLPTARAP